MNKAIHSFLKYRPSEEWILNNSHWPWLKLAIDIPWQKIIEESNVLYAQAVSHRETDKFANYSHEGWKSLTIYGIDKSDTKNTNNKMHWTEIVDTCPITKKFIEDNWIINEFTGRIRFMWLEPYGYILPHFDREKFGLMECNLAISHPAGCEFRFLDKGTVPFETGTGFLVDISNRHMIVNNSSMLRTHIIVHAKLKPGIVKTSYEQSFYN